MKIPNPFAKNSLRLAAVTAAILLLAPPLSAGEPKLVNDDGKISCASEAYTMLFGPDANLLSFKIGDQEFLAAQGSAIYQGAKKAGFGEARIEGSNKLVCDGPVATLEVTFGSDSIDWTIRSKSDEAFIFVLPLSEEVIAVRTSDGDFLKTPLKQKLLTDATWYGAKSCVEISSSFNTGGPWGGWQVLATYVRPSETHEFFFKVRPASSEEIADVQNAPAFTPIP